jgi:acyl-CoA thioesterase I
MNKPHRSNSGECDTNVAQMITRRRWLGIVPAAVVGAHSGFADAGETLTLYTFGDSVLDCGRYNEHGVHPGQLLVRNDDRLFPEFRGQHLSARGTARLEHRARDGATMSSLPLQGRSIHPRAPSVAIVTIGGNDLIGGLAGDRGGGIKAFEAALDAWLRGLAIRPVLLANVYDPTFGDDSRNFLRWDAKLARANFGRMNDVLASLANRYGKLADIHGHFLKGDPSWFIHTIEPSLRGASEVRRVFLAALSRT